MEADNRAARKEALQSVHVVIKGLGDEDLLRVQKLVRVEVKSRGSLAALQSEIDTGGGAKNATSVSDKGKKQHV
jgi:hypothetical protein